MRSALALPGVAPTSDAILSDCGRYRYLLTRGAPSVDCVWARSRITQCRDVEARFDSRSQSMIEAATERRALQAVLRILDGEETPR